MLPLFDAPPEVDRALLKAKLAELAAEGLYFGGSSWKYEGWLGSIYTSERYFSRGRFSKKRFEETCLEEYAEVFPVVCGDFSYYNFPTPDFWAKLFREAPAPLQFAFKTPEAITVAIFPQHLRYGARAGLENPAFLDAGMLDHAFLELLRPYRSRVPVIILEFSTFSKRVYADLDPFVSALDRFLSALPDDFRFAVEIRNPEFFESAYLDCLRRHKVAHIFNAWTRMPTLTEQLAVAESWTADFAVTRAILRQGRSYEEAEKLFAPFEHIQERNQEVRDSLVELARQARERKRVAYLFVHNGLEGNAPGTIQAIAERL